MIGHAAPRTELTRDVGAAAVREHEIEDDRVRRRKRGGGERALCRVGGVDLVAGAAQARLQRTQDVRLVVDYENASAHACTAGRVSAASASTKCPPAGSSCVQSRPPFASAKPRAIARPRPEPAARPPAERLEDRGAVGRL